MNKKTLFVLVTLFVFISPNFLKAVLVKDKYSAKFEIINVRKGPSLHKKILWRVEQYSPFIVLEKKGNWYKIQDFEEDKGWVHSSCLTQKIETVITTQPNRVARENPTITAKAVFKTKSKGVPFKVIKKEGEWFYVHHSSGTEGWLHEKDVW